MGFMIEKTDDKNYAFLAAHLRTLESAKSVLYVFKEKGIDAIVLKGLYLALKIYKDLRRQPGSDIDLLVKHQDIFRAKEVLNGLGWRERADILSDLSGDYGKSGTNSLMFFSQDGSVSIHLHWHLINGSWPMGNYVKRVDMDEIWREAVDGDLDGAPVKELKPEHLLIHLCWHGLNHFYAKPVYSEDIKVAWEYFGPTLDQDYLRAIAQRWGLSWILDYGLTYARSPHIGRYRSVFWTCLVHEKGVRSRGLFLWRAIFPLKSQLAMVNDLPIGKIGPQHYFLRIVEFVSGSFMRA
jgi:hypothetical protein